MKPVISGSAIDRGPGETASTKAVTLVHVAKHVQQRQEGAFQLELDTVTSVEDADSEEEETGDHTSILHELGSEGSEDELTFSTMGADDVALVVGT